MKHSSNFVWSAQVGRRAPLVVLAAALVSVACGGTESAKAEPCEPAAGVICSVVGTGVSGLTEDGLPALETELYLPQDMTLGPDEKLYVVDWNNHRVRVVDDGVVHTVVGTGYLGDAPDGKGGEISLNHPTHIAFDQDDRMIISAWHNSKVLRYDPDTDQVRSICGTGARSFNSDGLPGLETFLDLPVATAVDDEGAIIISDQANQRIRRLTPDGIVETVAGTGVPGYSGDGGPAIEAELNLPVSQSAPPAGRIAMDNDGSIYLADTFNHVVRKITAEGVISTIAGTGEPGKNSSKVAAEAKLDTPTDVAVDKRGNVYVADTDNSCVRKVTPKGAISTVAGRCGKPGNEGDGGPATEARLDRPYGVELGSDGALYIADTHNHLIRVVYPK